MIPIDPKSQDGGYTPPKSNTPIPITVEMPHEPPPEVLKQEFKIDADVFKHDAEGGKVITEDKSGKQIEVKVTPSAEETKKEEEKKLSGILKAPKETKKEEPKVEQKKEEEKKGLILLPSKEVKKDRDLSGYTSEEQTVLRQMSNDAFEFTSKLLKEHKEGVRSKDDTFLQHPDAYTLMPQYQQLRTKVTLAYREGDYWKQCLIDLDAGKPIKDLVGWDENGNPKFGAEYQPDKNLEITVTTAMQQAYGMAQSSNAELSNYPTKFKSQIANDLKAINDERSKRFGWVADPKYLDYTLDMGSDGEKSIKDIRQTIINLFPPYLRNSPATEVAADLFVALRIQDTELKEARDRKQVEQQVKEEEKKVEPSSNVKPGKQPDTIGGVKEFNLEGMPT